MTTLPVTALSAQTARSGGSPVDADQFDGDQFDGEDELVLSTVITHRFLRAGNTVHHFLLAGDAHAAPILLLGGGPDSWWTWHGRIEALAARCSVVAPDLLDHSLRPAQIVAMLDALAIDGVHLVVERDAELVAGFLAETGMGNRVISCARLGTGPLANLDDPEVANQAILEWLELREHTVGGTDEGRRARAHLPQGP